MGGNLEKEDEYEGNLAKLMQEQQEQSDIMQKETFFGIQSLINKTGIDTI